MALKPEDKKKTSYGGGSAKKITPNSLGRDMPADDESWKGTNKDYYNDVRDAMEDIMKEKRK